MGGSVGGGGNVSSWGRGSGGGGGGSGGGNGVMTWGRILLLASVVLMLGSAAYEIGFAKDNEAGAAAGIPRVIFSVGFSYFVGYVVAFALRTVMFTVICVCIFMTIVMLGLRYLGIAEINWNPSSQSSEEVASSLGVRSGWMKAYVNGVLPSAVAVCVGLYAGWRRR